MDLSFASLTREFKVTLKGALYYTTNLGTDVFGNILRLDNLLESMEERINKMCIRDREMVAALGQRAEKVRNRMVDSTEDNMLLITNDGRKLALDQRLLNPLLPDSDTSKINACVGDVFDIWPVSYTHLI